MGTRMVSSLESPVHDNFKRAILDAAETDTVFLNRFQKPGLRALRTRRSEALERSAENVMSELGHVKALYFDGDLEASVALSGQVVGRIDEVKPVAQIIEELMDEFHAALADLRRYAAAR